MAPSVLRGRPSTATHLYDDTGRVFRTVTESPWTDEDRKLMLAYKMHLNSLCPGGCGQPRRLAHHPDNEGWYDVDADRVVCHACTALERAKHEGSKEPVKPIEFISIVHDRDYATHPLLDLSRDLVA